LCRGLIDHRPNSRKLTDQAQQKAVEEQHVDSQGPVEQALDVGQDLEQEDKSEHRANEGSHHHRKEYFCHHHDSVRRRFKQTKIVYCRVYMNKYRPFQLAFCRELPDGRSNSKKLKDHVEQKSAQAQVQEIQDDAEEAQDTEPHDKWEDKAEQHPRELSEA
jgi:hypothetical protein